MIKSRKLWVEALRSGKYEQAREAMKSGNAYCCLGVAQKIALENGIKFIPTWLDEKIESESDLPEPVAKWLKIGTDDQYALARCNDGTESGDHSYNHDFDDIAFLIENLP